MVYPVSCTAVCYVTVITLFIKKVGVVRPNFLGAPTRPQWLRPCLQFLGRITVLCRCGLLLQTSVVCRSVCLSVTIVSPAKTAEPIEMPFGIWTRVDLRKHVLDDGAN